MMSDAEKLEKLKKMTDETDNDMLSVYLGIAASHVCRKAFPYDFDKTEVPDRYASIQVEIAAYLVQKRGAEGEIAHSENGISRSYDSGDVPSSLLRDITPFVAIL